MPASAGTGRLGQPQLGWAIALAAAISKTRAGSTVVRFAGGFPRKNARTSYDFLGFIYCSYDFYNASTRKLRALGGPGKS